jgi:signal transduction histidine kinase
MGKNISYEIDYSQPDGSVTWFYVRLFPLTKDKQEIFGLMVELSDITERKSAEENLKTAYLKIQKHVDSIKEMAWKQSHLIRGPIANLKGLSAMLNDNPLDAEVLKFIELELERLDKVIIDMAEDASNPEL